MEVQQFPPSSSSHPTMGAHLPFDPNPSPETTADTRIIMCTTACCMKGLAEGPVIHFIEILITWGQHPLHVFAFIKGRAVCTYTLNLTPIQFIEHFGNRVKGQLIIRPHSAGGFISFLCHLSRIIYTLRTYSHAQKSLLFSLPSSFQPVR